MDWKVFLATFTAILFAELADKTQLVGMSMSAESKKPIMVFLGSVSAYVIITGVSVLLGLSLAKFMKPEVIRYVGATLFVVIGVLMFAGKI